MSRIVSLLITIILIDNFTIAQSDSLKMKDIHIYDKGRLLQDGWPLNYKLINPIDSSEETRTKYFHDDSLMSANTDTVLLQFDRKELKRANYTIAYSSFKDFGNADFELPQIRLEYRAGKRVKQFSGNTVFIDSTNLRPLENDQIKSLFHKIASQLLIEKQIENGSLEILETNDSLISVAEYKLVEENGDNHRVKVGIIFNTEYVINLDNNVLAVIIMHEIGHKQLDHFSGLSQELEADEFAGGMLARHKASLKLSTDSSAFLIAYDLLSPNSEIAQRKKYFRKGWINEIERFELESTGKTGKLLRELREIDDSSRSDKAYSLENAYENTLEFIINDEKKGLESIMVRLAVLKQLGRYSYDLENYSASQAYFKIASLIDKDPGLDFWYARARFRDVKGKYDQEVVNEFKNLLDIEGLEKYRVAEINGHIGQMYLKRSCSNSRKSENLLESEKYLITSYRLDSTNSIVCRNIATVYQFLAPLYEDSTMMYYTKSKRFYMKEIDLEKNQVRHEKRINNAKEELDRVQYQMIMYQSKMNHINYDQIKLEIEEIKNDSLRQKAFAEITTKIFMDAKSTTTEVMDCAKNSHVPSLVQKAEIIYELSEMTLTQNIHYSKIEDGELILRWANKYARYGIAYDWLQHRLQNGDCISDNFFEKMYAHYISYKNSGLFCSNPSNKSQSDFIEGVMRGNNCIKKAFDK